MPTEKKTGLSKGSKVAGLQTSKIDWNAARDEYIADQTVSYVDIAKKYGVSRTAVGNRGVKEGWTELRQKLADRAYDKFQSEMLAQKERAQSHQLLLYQNLQALCNKSIQAIANQNFLTDRDGKVILDINGKPIQIPPNPFALEKLAVALEKSINGERVVLGLPTSVTKSETDVNFNNPYEKYTADQLAVMLESTDAKLRSLSATEATLVADNGTR